MNFWRYIMRGKHRPKWRRTRRHAKMSPCGVGFHFRLNFPAFEMVSGRPEIVLPGNRRPGRHHDGFWVVFAVESRPRVEGLCRENAQNVQKWSFCRFHVIIKCAIFKNDVFGTSSKSAKSASERARARARARARGLCRENALIVKMSKNGHFVVFRL